MVTAGARPTEGRGRVRKLNIVAHQDDSLLFMSPDVVDDMSRSWSVETVVLTDGWSTLPGLAHRPYVEGRNAGLLHAIADMAGVADPTCTFDALALRNGSVARASIAEVPEQTVVFLDLLEYGHAGGSGAGGCNLQGSSLAALQSGCVDHVTSNTGLTYTKDELIDTIVELIERFGPDEVRMQDPDPAGGFPLFAAGAYPWPDHPDHTAGASLALDATDRYRDVVDDGLLVTAYRGYDIAGEPSENVASPDLETKLSAFDVYAGFDADPGVGGHLDPSNLYYRWLRRQYYR